MSTNRVLAGAVLAVVIAGCEAGRASEPDTTGGTVSFQLEGHARVMSGTPAADEQHFLNGSFAAAHADSLSGFAVVGFERTGAGVGNLIVLQAPREVATFACAADSAPCSMRPETAQWHGRYIEGVRSLTAQGTESYFHLASGTLSVVQVGPDRLRATFSGVFSTTVDGAAVTRVIENGTVDVPYVTSAAVIALIECMIGPAQQCT